MQLPYYITKLYYKICQKQKSLIVGRCSSPIKRLTTKTAVAPFITIPTTRLSPKAFSKSLHLDDHCYRKCSYSRKDRQRPHAHKRHGLRKSNFFSVVLQLLGRTPPWKNLPQAIALPRFSSEMHGACLWRSSSLVCLLPPRSCKGWDNV